MRATLRWVAAAVCLALPAEAGAQAQGSGRIEFTGAGGLQTAATLGAQNGNLQANALTSEPFALFRTESRLARAWLADVRVGFVWSPRVALEARAGYSRPALKTSVSADAEGAAAITIVERIDQYVIDGGIVVRLDEMRIGRLIPYAAGGAGYLRQLHEGLTAIEDGHVYYLGGGVTRDVWTRARRRIKAAGLRVDARVYLLSSGISVDNDRVTQGAVTAGFFLRM